MGFRRSSVFQNAFDARVLLVDLQELGKKRVLFLEALEDVPVDTSRLAGLVLHFISVFFGDGADEHLAVELFVLYKNGFSLFLCLVSVRSSIWESKYLEFSIVVVNGAALLNVRSAMTLPGYKLQLPSPSDCW